MTMVIFFFALGLTPELKSDIDADIEGCQNVVFFYVWGWMEKAYIVIDNFAFYSAEFLGQYKMFSYCHIFCL